MARLHLILENVDEAEKYGQKGIAADPQFMAFPLHSWTRIHRYESTAKQIAHFDNALNALDEIIQNTPNSSDLQNLQSEREHIQNELDKLKK